MRNNSEMWAAATVFGVILYITIMVLTNSFGARCEKYFKEDTLNYHECIDRLAAGEKIYNLVPDIKTAK